MKIISFTVKDCGCVDSDLGENSDFEVASIARYLIELINENLEEDIEPFLHTEILLSETCETLKKGNHNQDVN